MKREIAKYVVECDTCRRIHTTEQGFSNTNLCYNNLINVLLVLLVTHLVSVPICDVIIA